MHIMLDLYYSILFGLVIRKFLKLLLGYIVRMRNTQSCATINGDNVNKSFTEIATSLVN